MRSEAPLISKALRLASVVIIVAVVALAASVAYSGFQEYKILGSAFSSQGSQQGNGIQMSMNGSELSLSGLSIPNNMTYPLSLQLRGTISLAGVSISSFNSPMQVIMPGQTGQLQVSANVNFSKVLSNSSAVSLMLQEPVKLATSLSIYAAIDPVANLNVTRMDNSTIGPVLGQFSVTPETPY